MKTNVNSLIFDEAFFPRHAIDRQNVAGMKEALTNGISLPPIVACKKTKKIIDGYHRFMALVELFGEDAKHEITFETYRSDKQRLMRAIQLNYTHGLKLSRYDLAHCVILGQKWDLSKEDIAKGLGVRPEYIEGITRDRFARNGGSNALQGKPNPLKRSIRHKANMKLTPEQQEANAALSGWPARFHAEQLILMISTDLIDTKDAATMDALQKLKKLLTT